MNTRPDPGRVAAHADGELGLDDQLAVEAQLQADAAARHEFEAVQALRDSLRQQADYHAAPESLRRFAAGLALEGQGAAKPARASMASRLRALLASRSAVPWWTGTGGLAAGLLLSFGFLAGPPAGGGDPLLVQEAVAAHVRASVSDHRVDVASSDHHTVKPWLSARLGYSPPVPELDHPGLAFDGGRVDWLDGRPVAVLAYRQGRHQVDAYVWPSGTAHDAAASLAEVNGFRVARWTQQGMRWCLVSDVNAQEFDALVAAFRQAGQTS